MDHYATNYPQSGGCKISTQGSQDAAPVDGTPEQRPTEARCAVATGSHPPAPDRFDMGDKRRFHWRQYNERYEVYSVGLDQWAECDTPEHAATVAEALEAFYANKQSNQPL